MCSTRPSQEVSIKMGCICKRTLTSNPKKNLLFHFAIFRAKLCDSHATPIATPQPTDLHLSIPITTIICKSEQHRMCRTTSHIFHTPLPSVKLPFKAAHENFSCRVYILFLQASLSRSSWQTLSVDRVHRSSFNLFLTSDTNFCEFQGVFQVAPTGLFADFCTVSTDL